MLTRRQFLGASAAGVVGSSLVSPAIVRAAEPTTIGLVPANAIYWDIYVGVEKGYFREAGFQPQLSTMQSSPASVQQAITHAYQIAAAQPEPFIAAVERGASMLGALAAPMNRPDWCLNVRPEIKTAADLKGKTIGVSALRNSEVWLTTQYLQKAGLTKADFNYIVVGTSASKLTALSSGSIAGTILFEPSAEVAISAGFPALVRYAGLRSYPPVLYVVDKDWAKQNDNGVRASGVIKRAHAWLWDPANRQEALQILAKITKRERASLEPVYDYYFVTEKIYGRSGEVQISGLDRTLADMAEDGEILKSPAPPASKYLLDKSLGGLFV